MKVLFLSSGFPTPQDPLPGIFELDQARAVAKKGIEVIFLVVDLRSFRRKRHWGYEKGVLDGVEYHIANIPLGIIFPPSVRRLVGRIVTCYLFNRAFKDKALPNIMHAHFTGMGYFCSLLSRKYSIPYIVTEHSSLINQPSISTSLKKIATDVYINASTVVAVSSALSKRIYQHTSVKSIVIPNIIDVNVFLNVKKNDHTGFNVVTTSNLIPLKRTNLLITAISNVASVVPNIHMTIIGDGPEKSNLYNLAKELGVADRISFLGVLHREEIASVYKVMDCFAMVSSTETFGVSYAEAIAAGLPVIATRCGGPEDFVDNTNGLLIDVDDVHQLESALIEMSKSFEQYESNVMKSAIVKKFSPDTIANSLIKLYKEYAS